MSATGNQRPTSFPTVPPSLSAGDHGMRDFYPPAQDDAQRSTPNTVENVTPYLGLRSRLSQIWINRWTVLLFLILVRILMATDGLNHNLGSAKTEAMSACQGVESMGSAMASMPHYLSAGVNELAASGVEKAVQALMSMLLLTITGVEEMIVFFINLLTSTYVCLITLLVRGSLHVALKVVEEVTDFVNNTLQGISDGIGEAVDGFETDFDKFTGALNSIPKTFGGDKGKIPKIDLKDEQAKLTNFELPGDLDQGLSKINESIPTFDEVQKFTDSIIRLPFEEVKKLINGSIDFSFNRSLLPVPQKEKLSFCTDNNEIGSFFDKLSKLVNDARKIFIAVLVILAIAVCIPMAYREIRRYRFMQRRSSKLVGDPSIDPMDVIYLTSRPYSSSAGIRAAAPFSSFRQQVLVRWVVAYATSTPALLVLSLGITGLLSCLCQVILLKAVEKQVPGLANEVGQFAEKVVGALNNASASWANGTNTAILDVNNNINNNVFGWVNTTTGAVNGTLNGFVDQTTKVLNDTFGGTVLYEPIKEVFNCLIGLKIAGVQKGLTWVSNHAKVDFPLLNNDTFSLGAAASIADDSPDKTSRESFLSNPGGEATDKITNAVLKVTKYLDESIRTEAILSTCVLLVWVIILLLGIGRALWLAMRNRKNRGEGGPALEERPHSILNGPAPAYYETSRTMEKAGLDPFRDPVVRHSTPNAPEAFSSDPVQNEKVGFAGLRAPPREESPTRMYRSSVYPVVEKS